MNRILVLVLLSTFFVAAAQAKLYSTKENLFYEAQYDTYSKSTAQINQDNLKHIREFIADDYNNEIRDYGEAQNLPRYVARDVIRVAERNPVVGLWAYSKYDPKDQGIGFCFGRAMFTHIELAFRDFDRDYIKKAFVVGSMSTGDGNSWGWHVTTIAQSRDSEGNEIWLAIDPVTGVKTLREWYQEMYTNFSTDKKLKIYVTEAGRFGPSAGSAYNQGVVTEEFYNEYFKDMLNWFDENYKVERYQTPVVGLEQK